MFTNDAIERPALPETGSTHSRRALLQRSAAPRHGGRRRGRARRPRTGLPGRLGSHPDARDFPKRVLDFIVTQKLFGVTFLTEAVRRAPGTPSEQFLPVLRAADATEFDHVPALEAVGAKPLTSDASGSPTRHSEPVGRVSSRRSRPSRRSSSACTWSV